MKIYDVTVPIFSEMVTWPGDPSVEVEKTGDVDAGDFATIRRLNLGSHTGTHVDAFSHFKPGGKSLDEMDLSIYIGKARVMEIRHPEQITRQELEGCDWTGVERVVFKTANSGQEWFRQPFNERFVHITPEAAQFLVEKGIRLVGVDYLSVEGYHAEGAPTHHLLLEHGVYIVEGLYLKEVSPGWYELICLPMKIRQGDGAPARVVLREWAEAGVRA